MEVSRSQDLNTKHFCIQSMLTVTSLATLSVVFFRYLEEEGQEELVLIKSQEKISFSSWKTEEVGKGCVMNEVHANFPCIRSQALHSQASNLLIADSTLMRLQKTQDGQAMGIG